MGRRTVLLIVAALVALLGTSMVFIYARGADNRAMATQQPVQVLKAVSQINAGETLASAQSKGKLQLGTVPREQVLAGAVNSTEGLGDKVALSTIYPHEQIVTAKFGAAGDQSNLSFPKGNIAISVTLSDTGRVAGFVTPGSDVAIFASTTPKDETKGDDQVRLLMPSVQVIAVGATTTVSQTTKSAAGDQTTEALPKTLFTLSVTQDEAERIIFAVGHGELTFGLLDKQSKIKSGPGVTSANLFR